MRPANNHLAKYTVEEEAKHSLQLIEIFGLETNYVF